MTQNEIIEMARDLAERFGVRMCDEHGNTHDEELYAMGVDDVIDIIKLVAEKEREACAKVTRQISDKYAYGYYGNEVDTADEIEAAIRARGQANG